MTGGKRLSEEERRSRMRKWAEAVVRHYPVDEVTQWKGGMMDSRLLADEVIAYLDEREDEPWYCTCQPKLYRFHCHNCGKPVKGELYGL